MQIVNRVEVLSFLVQSKCETEWSSASECNPRKFPLSPSLIPLQRDLALQTLCTRVSYCALLVARFSRRVASRFPPYPIILLWAKATLVGCTCSERLHHWFTERTPPHFEIRLWKFVPNEYALQRHSSVVNWRDFRSARLTGGGGNNCISGGKAFRSILALGFDEARGIFARKRHRVLIKRVLARKYSARASRRAISSDIPFCDAVLSVFEESRFF